MRFYNGESRRHQKYALKPWQRALKRLSLGGKPLRSMTERESWDRRLQTPLGRALRNLSNE